MRNSHILTTNTITTIRKLPDQTNRIVVQDSGHFIPAFTSNKYVKVNTGCKITNPEKHSVFNFYFFG